MTLGELVILLGFKVDKQPLDRAETALNKAQGSAIKLLAGVTALNAAFAGLAATAAQAGQELQKWFATTGLSTDELQKWTYQATQFDVAANEVQDALKGIQDARTNLMLTGEGVQAWALLGIDPNQDPFSILRQLQVQLKQFDPALTRQFAQQLGISENLFQYLRQSNQELEKLNRNLIVTAEQRMALANLNGQWRQMVFALGQLRDRFIAALAPALTEIIQKFRVLIDLAAKWVNWLGGNSREAEFVRNALVGLAAELVALMGILSVGVTVVGAFKAILSAVALVATPVAAELAGIVAVLAGMALALGGLILLWDDFNAALEGGKSRYDWSLEITAVNALASGLERVANAWRSLRELQDKFRPPEWMQKFLNFQQGAANYLFPGVGSAVQGIGRGLDDLSAVQPRGAGASSVRIENKQEVRVDGAQDPRTVAREVNSGWKQMISDSAYQQPLPNY